MDEYGARARKLLYEFETYHGNRMTTELRERLSAEIMNKFASNIRNIQKVREALKFRGTRIDLTKEVSNAIEQDTIHQADDIDLELVCSFCNSRGHRNESCQKKERAIRQSNMAVGYQNNKTCNRCGYAGHT